MYSYFSDDSESEGSYQRAPKRKWSEEEDKFVRNQAMKFEKGGRAINYGLIAENLKSGRTAGQVKERWRNSLKPGLVKGPWTFEEKIQLLDAIVLNGQSWTDIRETMFSHRSIHCVKAKGRSLLGENLTKKLKNRCQKRSKCWSETEKQAVVKIHHMQYENVEVDQDFDCLEASQEFALNLEAIATHLASGKTPADVDRFLVSNCSCNFCFYRKRKICTNGDVDFKLSWTIHRALAIKCSLLDTKLSEKLLSFDEMMSNSSIPVKEKQESDFDLHTKYNEMIESEMEENDFDLDFLFEDIC